MEESRLRFIPFTATVVCFRCGWRLLFGIGFWWYEKPYKTARGEPSGDCYRVVCSLCARTRGHHKAEARIQHRLLEIAGER
jgi:hypothetical protein